jgi:hypothetical protein
MDEFGDPSVDETGISEAIEPHGTDGPSSHAISAIALEESSRGREFARGVDNCPVEVPDEPQHGESLVRFLYHIVMYPAHPLNISSSGGADGGGIGSRVIRIRLQFWQNMFLASQYLWHANDMGRLWEIRVMKSTRK